MTAFSTEAIQVLESCKTANPILIPQTTLMCQTRDTRGRVDETMFSMMIHTHINRFFFLHPTTLKNGYRSYHRSGFRSVRDHICDLLSADLHHHIRQRPHKNNAFTAVLVDIEHTFPSIIYWNPSGTLAKPLGNTSFGEGLILLEAKMSLTSFQISRPCLISSGVGVHLRGKSYSYGDHKECHDNSQPLWHHLTPPSASASQSREEPRELGRMNGT